MYRVQGFYHFTDKVGHKRRAVAHALYVSRQGPFSELPEYQDLEATGCGNLPLWAQSDPLQFWKASDEHERANGTTYREWEAALPRQLNQEQRLELVGDFIAREIGQRHVYHWAIHCPKAAIEGGDQPHVHLMFSERVLDDLVRDTRHFFRRANPKDPQRGGCRKANTTKTRTLRTEALVALRGRFADLTNEYLKRYGFETRVDHRSLKDQGIDRQPDWYMSPGAFRAMPDEVKRELLEYRQDRHVRYRKVGSSKILKVPAARSDAAIQYAKHLAGEKLSALRPSELLPSSRGLPETADPQIALVKASTGSQDDALPATLVTETQMILGGGAHPEPEAHQLKTNRDDRRASKTITTGPVAEAIPSDTDELKVADRFAKSAHTEKVGSVIAVKKRSNAATLNKILATLQQFQTTKFDPAHTTSGSKLSGAEDANLAIDNGIVGKTTSPGVDNSSVYASQPVLEQSPSGKLSGPSRGVVSYLKDSNAADNLAPKLSIPAGASTNLVSNNRSTIVEHGGRRQVASDSDSMHVEIEPAVTPTQMTIKMKTKTQMGQKILMGLQNTREESIPSGFSTNVQSSNNAIESKAENIKVDLIVTEGELSEQLSEPESNDESPGKDAELSFEGDILDTAQLEEPGPSDLVGFRLHDDEVNISRSEDENGYGFDGP